MSPLRRAGEPSRLRPARRALRADLTRRPSPGPEHTSLPAGCRRGSLRRRRSPQLAATGRRSARACSSSAAEPLAARPRGRVRAQVVRAARPALRGVVLARRRAGVVRGDAHGDRPRVARRDAEPPRDRLRRLHGVALRPRLVDDPAQMPGLVRERDDAADRVQRSPIAAAGEQARERVLLAAPDALEAARTSRPRGSSRPTAGRARRSRPSRRSA